MQSPEDRGEQFTEIFCKEFQLKYKRPSTEERSLLKSRSRNSTDKKLQHKPSAQVIKMKTAVVGIGVPATATLDFLI